MILKKSIEKYYELCNEREFVDENFKNLFIESCIEVLKKLTQDDLADRTLMFYPTNNKAYYFVEFLLVGWTLTTSDILKRNATLDEPLNNELLRIKRETEDVFSRVLSDLAEPVWGENELKAREIALQSQPAYDAWQNALSEIDTRIDAVSIDILEELNSVLVAAKRDGKSEYLVLAHLVMQSGEDFEAFYKCVRASLYRVHTKVTFVNKFMWFDEDVDASVSIMLADLKHYKKHTALSILEFYKTQMAYKFYDLRSQKN